MLPGRAAAAIASAATRSRLAGVWPPPPGSAHAICCCRSTSEAPLRRDRTPSHQLHVMLGLG